MEAEFVVLGLFVGLLVGMTGVGAGSLVTPALVLSGVSPAVAVGTDLVYAALSKTAGSLVAGRLPDLIVRRALAFVLLCAGTRLAFASF